MRILKRGKDLSAWKAENTPDTCPLCERKMSTILTKNHVVDHDHSTGEVRDVLCRNCNGLEGRIRGFCVRAGKYIDAIPFLRNLCAYWERTRREHTGVYYPGTKVVAGKIIPPPKPKRKRRKK